MADTDLHDGGWVTELHDGGYRKLKGQVTIFKNVQNNFILQKLVS